MQVIISSFKKNYRINKRAYPFSSMFEKVISGVISITLSFILYFIVFKGSLSEKFITGANTTDYITYIVIGQASYSLIFSTLLNVGRSLISEIREGTIEPLIISPANKIYYFLGIYLEQFYRTVIEFLVVIFIGMFFKANITKLNYSYIIIFVILVSISSFSISVFLAAIMVYLRDSYLTQNTIIISIGLLCGIYFPISYLPNCIQKFSLLIPFTDLINMFRLSMFSNSIQTVSYTHLTLPTNREV